MDPRHPQHQFSRSNASPYAHAPFQSSSNQAPFPAASHPPSAIPSYQEHRRRTSDNPYYPAQSAFARDAAPMPTSSHSRHASASSVGHGTPVNRGMPPPSSPQQQQQQQQQQPSQPSQHPHSYVPPPLSRGPPPSLGPPLGFPNGPTGRDLPSLPSIHRPGSVNSSMSISSMLGGPAPVSRESTVPPQSQYPVPPPVASATASTSYGPGSVHASPRMQPASSEFVRFRRPQTPDPPRMNENPRIRDSRANSAGSSSGALGLSTPETHRYSTPQTYQQRNSQPQQHIGVDERREHYPVRVPNPNTLPPRPSSQPIIYNGPSSRPADTGRLVADTSRIEPTYPRSVNYAEPEEIALRERQRVEEEAALWRNKRDRQEWNRQGPARGHDTLYNLARETAESAYARPNQGYSSYDDPWTRRQDQPGPDHTTGQQQQQPVPSSSSANYAEYSRQSTQPGGSGANDGYSTHNASRYQPTSYSQPGPAPSTSQISPYEAAIQERERQMVNAQEAAQHQPYREQQPAPSSMTYRSQESPQHASEDMHHPQHRSYLGVQSETSRKGRASPLPQAVQGAQGQISGPGSEPGIKNEFGKMFSGIGSGLGSMTTASTSSGPAQSPFSNGGGLRRDDADSVHEQMIETPGQKIVRTSSRGGGSGNRSRKLKEEDARATDDSSSGRRTPSGRAKRSKSGNQQATNQRTLPGHRYDISEVPVPLSQPVITPFRTPLPTQPSPPAVEQKIPIPHHHHINRHHHHHHHHHHHIVSPKPAVPIPKPKQIIRSQLVLKSVAHLPRQHLGHKIYEARIKPENSVLESQLGFASSSSPLPRFEAKENCTFTIRVPRVHLSRTSREELTTRRPLWGTDVYTDDSDVIAACIHSGWIRGEWPEDVDVSLLGLNLELPTTPKANGLKRKDRGKTDSVEHEKDNILHEPPPGGPVVPPADRDLHVTVLILPALEKYSSTVRFGMKSREWGSTHDGVSFMIHNIKWVSGVDTAKEAAGEGRRVRMRICEADDDAVEDDRAWRNLLEKNPIVTESFERGSPGPLGELKELGPKSWWKQPLQSRKELKKQPPPPPPPPQQQEGKVEEEMEHVAEREVEPLAETVVIETEKVNGDELRPHDTTWVS